MTQIISASISDEFYKLAKQNNLSWSEAMRIGLGVMFNERGVEGFDSITNNERKLLLARERMEKALQEANEELEKLNQKHEKIDENRQF